MSIDSYEQTTPQPIAEAEVPNIGSVEELQSAEPIKIAIDSPGNLSETELTELADLTRAKMEAMESSKDELSKDEWEEYRQLIAAKPLDAEQAKRMTVLTEKSHMYESAFASPRLPFEHEKRLLQLRYMKGSSSAFGKSNPLNEEEASEAAELWLNAESRMPVMSKEDQLRYWELNSRDANGLNPAEKEEKQALFIAGNKSYAKWQEEQTTNPQIKEQSMRLHELTLNRLSGLPKEEVKDFVVLYNQSKAGELPPEEKERYDGLQKQVVAESKKRFPELKRRLNASIGRAKKSQTTEVVHTGEDSDEVIELAMTESSTPDEGVRIVQSIQEKQTVTEADPDFSLVGDNQEDLQIGESERQFINQLQHIRQATPLGRTGDLPYYFGKVAEYCQKLKHPLAIGFPADNPLPLIIKTDKDNEGVLIESGNFRWQIGVDGKVNKIGTQGTESDLYKFLQNLGSNNSEELPLVA